MSHLQSMPCCWQILSQTFPHANHQITIEFGSRKWEILLNLEVEQLDSNLVFTTSCLYDLEKKPFSPCTSQFPPLQSGDKTILFLPYRLKRTGKDNRGGRK